MRDGPAAVKLDTLQAVETPEGIAISLRPAGVHARLLAFLIDLLIRIAMFIGILMVVAIAGRMSGAIALISVFALEWLYPVIFELAMGGATPGKRAMGLQVVMDSGLPVTPAGSVARNLLRTADFFPSFYAFGVISMLLRPDGKRIGDLAAGTIVVYEPPAPQAAEVPPGEAVAPARQLSLAEQSAILAWAGRAGSLTPERLEELAAIALPSVRGVAAAGPGRSTAGLLAVARWLLGRRPETTP